MPVPLILDCDTGTDDAVAILCAALHPDIDLLGVTTVWGNHDVRRTTAHTLQVLDHVGAVDVPVVAGADEPFHPRRSPLPSGRDDLPSGIGLPPASRPAADVGATEWLVETLRAATTAVTLVPTGPLTNIAAAVAADRRLVDSVAAVVALAGTHEEPGVRPLVERNVWCDPEAAAYVVRAGFERLVLVGMDATVAAPFDGTHAGRLRAVGTPAAELTAALLEERIGWYARDEAMAALGAAPLHDPLAVAAVVQPDVLTFAPARCRVDLGPGDTYGRTVFDLDSNRPDVTVALDTDRERYLTWLCSTLGSREHGIGPIAPR